MKLAAGTFHLRAGLHLVSALTLRSEKLFYRQVNHVIIRFNTENFFRQLNFSPGLFTFYISNFNLHFILFICPGNTVLSILGYF